MHTLLSELCRVGINSLIVKVDAEENVKLFPEQTKLLISIKKLLPENRFVISKRKEMLMVNNIPSTSHSSCISCLAATFPTPSDVF